MSCCFLPCQSPADMNYPITPPVQSDAGDDVTDDVIRAPISRGRSVGNRWKICQFDHCQSTPSMRKCASAAARSSDVIADVINQSRIQRENGRGAARWLTSQRHLQLATTASVELINFNFIWIWWAFGHNYIKLSTFSLIRKCWLMII